MKKILALESIAQAQQLCGPFDKGLKDLEKELRVRLTIHDNHLTISGSSARINNAYKYLEGLLAVIGDTQEGLLPGHQAKEKLKRVQKSKTATSGAVHAFRSGIEKTIGPKTKGQREYIESIKKYDIVFGVGPAGTGKTYLAMAQAVEALKKQEVRRIILTRPAIEAGESLGFLPGDMYEKISPYLRPLYDALYDMMDAERIEKYIETGIIEVAPLAYMRGRTLNDAFIVLDEAQNATAEQMKMFLTRIGFYSKAVITGDITQSDLPDGKPVGLLQAQEILRDIEGIKFVFLTGEDIVRHELVQKIIQAYDHANRQ
ncbi:MAG: PhoH family protein [Candidatus Omnitrophica bacterium]|nr:PhoH family protein [Candidatus Omnitrophota bacterium]